MDSVKGAQPPEERAVIDRFEGKRAILLLGDPESELVVQRTDLPDGASEGVWLRVQRSQGKLVSAVIDTEETERMRRSVADKMARLRRRDPGGKG